VNAFGLYDVAGNVWELVNDLYDREYYKTCPLANPPGPLTGNLMPDGKEWRCMRGGNWYNGMTTAQAPINDGHSRVSNRNPSYYRGPLDPNHPYYHIGFRLAKKIEKAYISLVPAENTSLENQFEIYPNPSNGSVSIDYSLSKNQFVQLAIFDATGNEIETLISKEQTEGRYAVKWNASQNAGFYYCKLQLDNYIQTKKIVLVK
jgi:Secretion system C-terminal sorting domain/Sulfatase-modifying factor enzyme 1